MIETCQQCGRTDPRAGTIWGCLACQQKLGLASKKCSGCGQLRLTVDDTGLCRICRRPSP